MDKPELYVGIDIASATFTAAVGRMGDKWQIVVRPGEFGNAYDSFPQFLTWLQQHGVTPEKAIVCMEATGVYGEVLAHYLAAHHYRLAIEPPLKVKRAFAPAGHKSDPVDSCQISEYAYRFFDELTLWKPRSEVLEQIQILLTVREELTVERTGHTNALKALQRKVVHAPLAEETHQTTLNQLKEHILALEKEIKRLIDEDPTFRQVVLLLMSIPGVGMLLAAHMLIVIYSATQPLSPKALAAFIGICPYENSSGSSINHPPTSRHYGPSAIRKLLFLASLSVRTHNQRFKQYFLRKSKEGKPAQLIINNIANKLLKIMCAVVRSNTAFIDDYQSVSPIHLI
jgi:transposase